MAFVRSSRMNPKKRWRLGIYSVLGGMLVALIYWIVVPVLHILFGLGVFDAQEMRKYQGSNEDNLRALYTAMTKYNESEGQFPDSGRWMDLLKPRIRTNDMVESEAEKKFVFPAFIGQAGKYGYAMNDAAGGKFKGDLPPKALLIFNSSDTKWNAHGDPRKLEPKHGEGITVDGTIVKG